MMITGTAVGETLNGTQEDDFIDALGGDDQVNGLGGADNLRGGDGDDIIDGGADADFVNGGAGEDQLSGGDGNDTIDSIDRGPGLFDGPVPAESDLVSGGAGDDVVTGGRTDVLDGGAGTDNLSINFDYLSTGPVNIRTIGSLGTVDDGTAFTGFEFLDFNLTEGDDTVDVGDVRASLVGGDGDDDLTTGASDDVLFGGSGNDVLRAGSGDDILGGGQGDDIIQGGNGDDSLSVGRTGEGADTVNLGAGMDTVSLEGFDVGQVRLTFTSAEVGNGTAADSGAMMNQDGGYALRFQAEDADGNLIGDISRYDDEGIMFVAGTQGITFDVRDLVSGAARGDTFEGVVLGTNGADDLTFFPPFRSGQNFYYNAGLGNDVIKAGTGNDFLVGGGGLDRLEGGDGNDSFIGGGGADVILGGAGNDTSIFNVATEGADRINLGLGDDVVNLSGAGQIRLTFTSAEVGNDSAVDSMTMANQDGGFAVRVQAEGSDGALTGDVARFDDEAITFVAAQGTTLDVRDLVSGAARGDQFQVATLGSSAGDTLTAVLADRTYYINGGGGADSITGGDVNDFLVGGAGDDLISAGSGTDTILGGGGNDKIYGGLGADRMEGGLGGDTYVVENVGDVVVEAADSGTDLIVSSITLTLGANIEKLTLSGSLGRNALGNDLNNVLIGNSGTNTLYGAAGRDSLTGGDGADRFDYNAISETTLANSDRITDLTSDDIIDLGGIDADTAAVGNQDFALVDAFSGTAGEIVLSYDADTNFTSLLLDVTGDGVADGRIVLDGDQSGFDNFIF